MPNTGQDEYSHRKSGSLKFFIYGILTTTAELALNSSVMHLSIILENLHATHGNQKDEHQSCSFLHIQTPDQESRQHRKCEIRNDTERTVQIPQRNDDIHAHARAITPLVPIMRDRLTLKKRHQKECDTTNDSAHARSIYNPSVNALRHDSQKEHSKRQL